MTLPSISTVLWSLAFEPFAFLLCLGVHFLPPWASTRITPLLSNLGFDVAQSHSYQPHPDAPFEGYYTRITTTTGATILLIFSTVRSAKKEGKPHLVHFSYISPENDGKTIVHNIYPEKLIFEGRGQGKDADAELTITAVDERGEKVGTLVASKAGTVEYWLTLPVGAEAGGGTLEVDIQLQNGTPWGGKGSVRGMETSPEGPLSALIHLLPLHWFVRNVSAEAEINVEKVVTLPATGEEQVELVLQEKGSGHIEKNWGATFPTGWVWIQSLVASPSPNPPLANGHEPSSPPYVALAGGSTLGLKAFLLGFTIPLLSPSRHPSSSRTLTWTFRPPFSMLLPLPFSHGRHASPFCRETYDSRAGLFALQITDWTWAAGWRRVVLTCHGPPGGLLASCDPKTTTTGAYIQLPCPMSGGHDNGFAKETFEAGVLVEAWVWDWAQGGWGRVAEQRFERAALEWGGEYWGGKSEGGGEGVPWLSGLGVLRGGKEGKEVDGDIKAM